MAMMTEHFTYKRERWSRHWAEADEAFVMGVDLGQSMDPTAIVVLHHTRTPLDTWAVNDEARTTKQNVLERFDVVHAERMKLGTSYPDVVAHVAELLARPPLRHGCHLVIDESGVGRAVGDMFDAAGLKPVRVSITAGTDATRVEHSRRWNVAKSLLTSGVDARLHTGELRFAAELTEAHALAEELKNFRRYLTAAGRATYQARTGKHDDLVLAVAIALWWALERRKHRIRVYAVKGLY
jgi:hypothetical protein